MKQRWLEEERARRRKLRNKPKAPSGLHRATVVKDNGFYIENLGKQQNAKDN